MDKIKGSMKEIVNNSLNYISANMNSIAVLYSRVTDIDYLQLRGLYTDPQHLVDIEQRISSFYVVRLKRELFVSFLQNCDDIPVRCRKEERLGVFVDYYNRFNQITKRNEISYTSKVLNLMNPDFPLYDSNVLTFLKTMGYREPDDKKTLYSDLLDFTDGLIETGSDKLAELRKKIYPDFDFTELGAVKFIDTLMYSVADGAKVALINQIG